MATKKTEVPDLLGDAQRAEMVGNAIRDLQSQEAALLIEQTMNLYDDSELVPTLAASTGQTFAERREQLQAGIARLAEDYWALKGATP